MMIEEPVKLPDFNRGKIRILHCVTALNRGGLETLLMNYYRNINHEDFEFDFLVQRKGKFDYSDEIRKMGGRIFTVSAFNPFKIRRYNRELQAFFRDNRGKYDIVHAHNNSFAMYVLRAAKKNGFNVRISHSHNSDVKFSLLKTPFVIYNKLKIKKTCNVKFACAEKAGKWLFGDDDFIVIKNAIELGRYSFNVKKRNELRGKYGIGDDTIILGHIGRFEKQKNHNFLIDIMTRMKKMGIDARLLLIGSGVLEKDIKKRIIGNGLENDVILAGIVENPYDYYNMMDVFVMPSYHEGLPMVLIEAQANGLPCVVSDKISRECSVTPSINFLPISSKKIVDWIKLICKEKKRQRVDYSALMVAAGFDIKTATETLENLYRCLAYIDNEKNRNKGGVC